MSGVIRAPDPIEIRSDTDFRAELADAAYQALLRLDRRKALGERLKAFTGILRGFKVGASVEGRVEFSFDPDAVSASTGNLERDLTQLFAELGETAKHHDTGVAFRADTWRPWLTSAMAHIAPGTSSSDSGVAPVLRSTATR